MLSSSDQARAASGGLPGSLEDSPPEQRSAAHDPLAALQTAFSEFVNATGSCNQAVLITAADFKVETLVALAAGRPAALTTAERVAGLAAQIAAVFRGACGAEQPDSQASLPASAADLNRERSGTEVAMCGTSRSLPTDAMAVEGNAGPEVDVPLQRRASEQLPGTPSSLEQRAVAAGLPPSLWQLPPAGPAPPPPAAGARAQAERQMSAPAQLQRQQRRPGSEDDATLQGAASAAAALPSSGSGGLPLPPPPAQQHHHPAPVAVQLPPEPRDKAQYVLESSTESVHDGYRWRKYGRKTVAGTQHLRHYFKCTTAGCLVRKHVERLASDPAKILVTYDYLPHTHEPPAGRAAAAAAAQDRMSATALFQAAASGTLPAAALFQAAASAAAKGATRIASGGGPPAVSGAAAASSAAGGGAAAADAGALPRPSAVGPRSPRAASAFSRWRDSAAHLARPSAAASGAAGSDHSSDSGGAGGGSHHGPATVAAHRRARGKAARTAVGTGGDTADAAAASDGSAAGGGAAGGGGGVEDAMDAESTGTDVQLFEEVIAEMHTGRR